MMTVILLLLVGAWLLCFPMIVGFLAAVLEKRMVWPYAPLGAVNRPFPNGTRDGENPFAPPGSADPVPLTDYSAFNNREASHCGFSLLGSFFDAKSKLYRIRYDFWLSDDRVVLAVIGGGTLAAIPLDATWLITRIGDGRCLFTVDEPKGADSDPSGLTHQEIITNADLHELLTRHLERVAAADHPAEPYSPTAALEEHRQFRQTRTDRLEERGLARFLDQERNAWKYNVYGAIYVAALSTLNNYRQAFLNRGRRTIRRPGDPGYSPSIGRRTGAKPAGSARQHRVSLLDHGGDQLDHDIDRRQAPHARAGDFSSGHGWRRARWIARHLCREALREMNSLAGRQKLGLPIALAAFECVEKDADLAVFVVAAIEQLVDREFFELADGLDQIGLEAGGGLAVVAVRSPQRFGNHFVDDAESQQVAAGHLERGRGFGRVLTPFPEDRGAPLRRDDRVVRELEHRQAVADADARAPLRIPPRR